MKDDTYETLASAIEWFWIFVGMGIVIASLFLGIVKLSQIL